MKIILKKIETELVIKNSRFINELFVCNSQNLAREIIKQQKDKYLDASHVCHAFVIGEGAEILGMSDAGEPSGTAGRPMLDVLKGSGITDILLTVTRYFGGTLLGTGGLVKAYGDSVKEVLALCQTEEYIERSEFSFECDWSLYETIKRKIEVFHISDLSEEFVSGVKLSGKIYSSELKNLGEMIKNLSKGKIIL